VDKNPELALETTDLPLSPWAITKRPRIGAASKGATAAGDSSTSLLDDVSKTVLASLLANNHHLLILFL
jgi:hypothetical protein